MISGMQKVCFKIKNVTKPLFAGYVSDGMYEILRAHPSVGCCASKKGPYECVIGGLAGL